MKKKELKGISGRSFEKVMTVKELIVELSNCNPEAKVKLATIPDSVYNNVGLADAEDIQYVNEGDEIYIGNLKAARAMR